jgi:hypothetical protein
LPLIVNGALTQADPLVLLRLRVGGLTHAVTPERLTIAVPIAEKVPVPKE